MGQLQKRTCQHKEEIAVHYNKEKKEQTTQPKREPSQSLDRTWQRHLALLRHDIIEAFMFQDFVLCGVQEKVETERLQAQTSIEKST